MDLHFKHMGDMHTGAPPLLMLHGLFGSSDNWLGVAPKLALTRPVFLVDLRNHGLSPHRDEMNYSLMAADIAEFLEARKLPRANVLGHSLGGKVAMQFALATPERVEKLIVVDMTPRACPPDHIPIFKALLALDLKQFESRRQIEDALAPEIPGLTLRRFLLKNLAHEPHGNQGARAFRWKIPLHAILANYPRLCEAIDPDEKNRHSFEGPALFLRGGQSPYVTDSDLPAIHKLFPQALLETVPAARHWVHADAPDEFVRHVSDFLKKSSSFS